MSKIVPVLLMTAIGIGLGRVPLSLLVGTSPLVPLGATPSMLALVLSLIRYAGEQPTLGKCHGWLFAALTRGLLLQAAAFLALWRGAGMGRGPAFALATIHSTFGDATSAIFAVC